MCASFPLLVALHSALSSKHQLRRQRMECEVHAVRQNIHVLTLDKESEFALLPYGRCDK